MTIAAFIAWADRQPGDIRYELVDGYPVPLARPGPRAYTAGSLVPTRVDDTGRVPDLLVTCDERDQRDDDDAVAARSIRYPKLIAEILSASNDVGDLGSGCAGAIRTPGCFARPTIARRGSATTTRFAKVGPAAIV